MFPRDEESLRRVGELEKARAWRRAGLLSEDSLKAVEAGGPPAPAVAGKAVRLLMFGLAWIVLGSLGLGYGLFSHGDGSALGVSYMFRGLLALGAAEVLCGHFKLHRFGADEFLLLAGPVYMGVGAALLVGGKSGEALPMLAGGGLAALAFAWTYARERRFEGAFGFILAASVAVLSWDVSRPRLLLTVFWAALLAAALARRSVPEHEADTWDAVVAALALLVPIAFNQKLEALGLSLAKQLPASSGGSSYWFCYAAGWLWPGAALAAGLFLRRRPLLVAGGVGLLLAIATNKPYLGLARQDWDPAILGAALLALAVVVDRWLRAGLGGMRHGFTAESLDKPREDGLAAVDVLAALAPGAPGAGQPAAEKSFDGGGGKSGGAGASGGF